MKVNGRYRAARAAKKMNQYVKYGILTTKYKGLKNKVVLGCVS